MAEIKFILKNGEEKIVEAQDGLSLMEVALQNEIEGIEGTCGGGLACATCHAYIHPDYKQKTLPDEEISEDEEDMLDLAFDVRDSSRLCCQIIVDEDLDGLTLGLPGSDVDW